MFSIHTTPEEFENATITGHFGCVFEENLDRESHDYRDAIVFEKLRFQNDFCPHENEMPAFLIPPVWKGFGKAPFRDGLEWTVGLTLEINLRFQISPA